MVTFNDVLLLWRTKGEDDKLRSADESRKPVLLIATSILAARKLSGWTGGWSPAAEAAVSDAITLAEKIMWRIDSKGPESSHREHPVGNYGDEKFKPRRLVMDIRPALSFSNRLSLRDFEAEMWKLYFGFVKGLLMAITSVIYLLALTAFFIAQHAVLIASKVTGSVIAWSPEKPRVFGMRTANGE